MPTRLTSRTAFLTYLTCARKRYLMFHYSQGGLSPELVDINLLTGTCVHRGLQHLLEHCRIEHPSGDFEEKCIDEAVKFALTEFKEQTSTRSLNLHSTEFMNVAFVIEEHESLIEALIRAFAIKRLPSLLDEYEVLEVEHEEVFELSSPTLCNSCNGTGYEFNSKLEDYSSTIHCKVCKDLKKIGGILFLAKADGLFRRKLDNKLVVLSIKTTSEYPDDNLDELGSEQFSSVVIRNILHDMQGCSEWVVIQDRLDKAWNRLTTFDLLNPLVGEELDFLNQYKWMINNEACRLLEKPEIYAVQYEHLVTGKRRQSPAKSGIYKRANFLIHPLKFDSIVGISPFSKMQSFEPADYKWKWGSGRQAKGWNQINIWEDIGIKMWLDLLASVEVQPEEGNPLDEMIRTSELIIRSSEDLEEWKISIKFWEERISKDLNVLESLAGENKWDEFKIAMNQRFNKDTTRCHNYYGGDCIFTPVCHGGHSLEDTQDTLYTIRHPHHDLETQEFIKKGLIK